MTELNDTYRTRPFWPSQTALLNKQGAREARWIANWASLISDMLLDPRVATQIRAMIERPEVQRDLKKIYEEESRRQSDTGDTT